MSRIVKIVRNSERAFVTMLNELRFNVMKKMVQHAELANGGAAIHLSNQTVATITPSESGFIFGDCAGLGYLSPESAYEVHVFCTFTETGNDSFDIKGEGGVKGGSVEIIGGSGKWIGATGTGTFTRKWADGPRGSYDYEFHITTP